MNLKEIQRPELKDVQMTIRTTSTKKQWMKDNNVSPQRVFELALEELMEEEK